MTTIRTDLRRRGIVYGINILDPATGRVRVDYIGQTRQKLTAREGQHRADQPFSDLIVGRPFIIEQGMWTDEELTVREFALIAERRPRYNYEANLGNPNRIPKFTARDQRWARDDAAGRPRWIPPDQRVSEEMPALDVLAEPGPVALVLWRPYQLVASTWLAVWVGASTLSWLALGSWWVNGWVGSGLWMSAAEWVWLVACLLGAILTGAVARRWYRKPSRRKRR